MRRVIITFLVGIFLVGVSSYFIYNISPFNLTKVNELIRVQNIQANDWQELSKQLVILVDKGEIVSYLSANAFVCDLIISIGIFLILVSTHLTIDKLFFRTFHEKASLLHAIRRGLFFVTTLNLILLLKLNGADLLIIIIIPIIFIIMEILFITYFHEPILKSFNNIKLRVKKVNDRTNTDKKY